MGTPLLSDPISSIASLAESIITRVWPNRTEENLAQIALAKEQIVGALSLMAAQAAANVESAKSSSVFVAGARPFLLWVCGFAFAYQYVLRPLLPWVLIVGFGKVTPPMPGLDGGLMELTMAMLGLAGWRSYDKKNGKA